jgi:hypothetical protein
MFMFSKKMVALAVLGMLVPLTAFAVSLEDKKKHAQEEESMSKADAKMNTDCGTKLASKIDWDSFKDAVMGGYTAYSRCSAIEETIGYMCRDKDVKESVSKTVKKYTCHFGGKDATKRALTLKNGAIDYTLGLDSSNDGDFIKSYFMKNLQ